MPKHARKPKLEIIECEQGSPEWYEAKLGIVSASDFSDVLSFGDQKVRGLYMRKLAGEILFGIPRESYTNQNMERGQRMESQLRAEFAMRMGIDPVQIGFAKRGRIGCSPDALVGNDAVLEIKSQAPHLLIETIESNRVPPAFMPQIQGNMYVLDRAVCHVTIGYTDVAEGYEGIDSFRTVVKRDDAYIARLEIAINAFIRDLDELVERIRSRRA